MTIGSISIDDLRALVEVDPQQALRTARQRLAAAGGAEAAELWWVAGVAERLLGDTARARGSLEQAARLARGGADAALHARITISLAFDVGNGGDLPGALALLDSVAGDVDTADQARFASQRGLLLYFHGRLSAAIASLRRAHELAVAVCDEAAAMQVLVNLGA